MIQKLLDKKKEEITLKIRADMKDQHLAITHDGWTSLNTESYSTVTGNNSSTSKIIVDNNFTSLIE